MFGAAWGVVEFTLGTTLHLAKIPLRGFLMAFIAGIILVTAKEFVRFRGSLLLVGALAATFKVLSMGGFMINPVVAIFLEAVLAELVFLIFGYNRISALAAGCAVVFYTLLHAVIAHLFYFGAEIITVYKRISSELASVLHLEDWNFTLLMIILVILNLIMGVIAGFLGKRIAERTQIIMKNDKK